VNISNFRQPSGVKSECTGVGAVTASDVAEDTCAHILKHLQNKERCLKKWFNKDSQINVSFKSRNKETYFSKLSMVPKDIKNLTEEEPMTLNGLMHKVNLTWIHGVIHFL
jgi:hypothetical protein